MELMSGIRCCGCGVCIDSCFQNAISFQNDADGIKYPVIDAKLCINCGNCIRNCPEKEFSQKHNTISAYAGAIKRSNDIMRSASGGIFYALAAQILRNGGTVFGAEMVRENDLLFAKHVAVRDERELYRLQGSKYVQSRTEGVFKAVKSELDKGVSVLFSGTPCQCAALRKYLKSEPENLLIAEIICHGVPGEKIFNDYIQILEKQIKGTIINFRFRDKTKGWGQNCKVVYVPNGKTESKSKILYPSELSYYMLFENGILSRPSCASCRFAEEKRVGDLTLGDYWGVASEQPLLLKQNGGELDETKGISAVLVNTDKGKKAVKHLQEEAKLFSAELSAIRKRNPQLEKPAQVNAAQRERYMKAYRENGFDGIERTWRSSVGEMRVKKIYNRAPSVIKRLLRKLK